MSNYTAYRNDVSGATRSTPIHPAPSTPAAIVAIVATVAANVAFTVLGARFDYPDVLQHPAVDVLHRFAADRPALMAGFGLLTLASAGMAWVALGWRRTLPGRWARVATACGVAAAVVQVVGLSRWLLVVPALSSDPERWGGTFEVVSTVLGTVVGESMGYALTACWTVLLCLTARRDALPHLLRVVGVAASIAIAAGLLTPLGVPGADTVNFWGYVVWSAWLLVASLRVVARGRR